MKLASVKLAMKYMKRVSAELGMVAGGPEEEELIVQGVKFAFRVHQVNNFGRVSFYQCTFIMIISIYLMLRIWSVCGWF